MLHAITQTIPDTHTITYQIQPSSRSPPAPIITAQP
jgi:hypothetical protein